MESDELTGFAIAVTREDTQWVVVGLSDSTLDNLVAADAEIRKIRSSGPTFGLINVDDEFFIIIRPGPKGTSYFLSDATAALDYDVAEHVLEALHIEIPELDDEEFETTEPWPEGDHKILADLGLSDDILSVIVDDYDLYADEQIERIAESLGFSAQLEQFLPFDDDI